MHEHTHTHTHTHTHIYIYIYIFINTYRHTDTHTYSYILRETEREQYRMTEESRTHDIMILNRPPPVSILTYLPILFDSSTGYEERLTFRLYRLPGIDFKNVSTGMLNKSYHDYSCTLRDVFLVTLLNSVPNLVAYFIPSPLSCRTAAILLNQYLWEERVHSFPNGIGSKVNIMVELEFQLTYTAQQFCNNNRGAITSNR